MQAMIFSAGLGTRFKPWTDKHPKPLAVVSGKSLLQRNIEYLQQFGITDLVVNVHHFPDQMIEAINQSRGWGSNVVISNESDELLETGGGLLKAKHLLHSDFVTINVDILTSLDLQAMIDFHNSQDALITLATANRNTTRFLLFNDKDRLCGWRNTNPFRENIVVEENEYLQKAYSGIAVYKHEVLDMIPFSGRFSVIDLFLALAPRHKILSFDHSGDKFIDVGKPGSVEKAENLFL